MIAFLWNWVVCLFVPFAGTITIFAEGIVGKDINGRKIKSHLFHILLAFVSLGIDLLLLGYGGNIVRAIVKILGRPFAKIGEKTVTTAVQTSVKSTSRVGSRATGRITERKLAQESEKVAQEAIESTTRQIQNESEHGFKEFKKNEQARISEKEKIDLSSMKENIEKARQDNLDDSNSQSEFGTISEDLFSSAKEESKFASKLEKAIERDPSLKNVAAKKVTQNIPEMSKVFDQKKDPSKREKMKEKILSQVLQEQDVNVAFEKLAQKIRHNPRSLKKLEMMILKLPPSDLVKKDDLKKIVTSLIEGSTPEVNTSTKNTENNARK